MPDVPSAKASIRTGSSSIVDSSKLSGDQQTVAKGTSSILAHSLLPSSFVPSFIPDLGAWRDVEFIKESLKEADPNAAPPSLKDYLLNNADITDNHKSKINELWMLVKNHGKMKYLDHSEARTVIEALRVAYVSLWGKSTLRSLEVSINRARGTAAVLGELKADTDIILAGILAEVIKELDTQSTKSPLVKDDLKDIISKLEDTFGPDVIALARSYNRLPKFMARKAVYTPTQAEYQIQMLVALVEDYRSLYIRLADRVHTMRVLKTLPLNDEERLKIAHEALHVYAPLAHKMQVMKVKGELEDLAFRMMDPEMFTAARYTQMAANKAYHEAADMIQDIIDKDSFLSGSGDRRTSPSYRFSFRIKDKYQLYLKLTRKNLTSLNEVRDALGLRVVIDHPIRPGETQEEHEKRGNDLCYYLVNRLRNMTGWEPAKDGYKDYIAGKKENGYQSLHQYIRNIALGTNVEVQVRTKAMHQNAELGEAAHWYYKDTSYRPAIANSKFYKLAWRSPQQVKAKSPAELIGMAKYQLLQSKVFVFLEDKSTVMSLKKNSTSLDAAFHIHSDIGLTAVTVSIGGKPVGFSRPLKNGDVVSVQRSVGPIAKMSWMNIVKTPHAQATLKKYFVRNHRAMLTCMGLIRLLMAIFLSAERIKARMAPGSVLDANKLANSVTSRTGLANLETLLVLLSTANKDVVQAYVGRLFDIPPKHVTVYSSVPAIPWAKLQNAQGWSHPLFPKLEENVIHPILREILPASGNEGMNIVSYRWCEMVGASDGLLQKLFRPAAEYEPARSKTTSSSTSSTSTSTTTTSKSSVENSVQRKNFSPFIKVNSNPVNINNQVQSVTKSHISSR